MECKIGLVLSLILSVLTVTFSGCVKEEVVTPTQTKAPRVEAAPTPVPTATPKANSDPTSINKYSARTNKALRKQARN